MHRWIIPLIVLLFFIQPLCSQSLNSTNSESQEVYFNFTYSLGLINTVVTAVYVEPEVYLPIGEIFRLLKVNYKFDSKLDSVYGFFVRENRQYKINFRTKIAICDTTTILIHNDEFIHSRLDVFLVPSVFERLFGLRFEVDMGRLMLTLSTNEELPIIAERNRERRQKMVEGLTAARTEYPLLFPRNKNLIDGGVLDYSFSAASTSRYKSYGYDLRGGGIIAGGDLEIAANGNYNSLTTSSFTMEGRWRYVIDKNSYISNVTAGYIYTNDLFSRNFKGIQVSNEPVQVRTLFQTYVIEQKTYPLWTVELYLNDKLVAITKADGLGNYRFVVPLIYGTTNYSLRIYGPTGEIIEDRQRIQIPFSLVPAGEVNYTISGGMLRGKNNSFAQGSIRTGITSWLTSRAGFEYVDDTLYAKPIGSLSLSSWFGKNYIFTVDAAPGALYRADLSAVYASQISGGISITKHDVNRYYNPSHILTEGQAILSVPLMFNSVPITYRFQANRFNYEHSSTMFISTGGTVSYKQINGTIEYRLSESKYSSEPITRVPSISTAILYSFNPNWKYSFLTTNILLGSSLKYDLNKKTAEELRLDIASNVTPLGRLQLSYTRDFIRSQYMATLQFVYEFPVTRSTTTISSSADDASIFQSVRGTVGYDSHQKTFQPYNLEAVGLSALSLHMFVDKNGDGIYNKDEQTINDVAFNLGQAALVDVGNSGITRVRRLLPYTRYNIEIIESSISNPLWVPKAYAFSTITEPNIYKPIDLPFYASGVLEGSVLMKAGTTIEAVPGIEIHVKSIEDKYKKDIRVFADGSFYQLGIPPGKYIVYVDSVQLNVLGASCEPPMHAFEVKITADGDYIDGINFLLRKPETKKAVSNLVDSVKEQSVVTIIMPEEKYNIMPHKKPDGFVIQISTWDTERLARNEAKRIKQDLEIKTIVEKVLVDGKTKYAVLAGVFTSKAESFEALRRLRSSK